ncbi:hypothetical protein P5V15_015425 [Pogonomyrmex californicus]
MILVNVLRNHRLYRAIRAFHWVALRYICRLDKISNFIEFIEWTIVEKNLKGVADILFPEKILLLAIWMMGTPNSYKCVADRFGVEKGTAWRCIEKVMALIKIAIPKQHCETYINRKGYHSIQLQIYLK